MSDVLPAAISVRCLRNDGVKPVDEAILDERHVKTTDDCFASLGSQMPSEVTEATRLLNRSGGDQLHPTKRASQRYCLFAQRVSSDRDAFVVVPLNVSGVRAGNSRCAALVIWFVEDLKQIRVHQGGDLIGVLTGGVDVCHVTPIVGKSRLLVR